MDEFDYVVVGGGSAGCVLANRLSADPRNSVCLIEAGPDTPPDQFPHSIFDDFHLPDYFEPYRYWTELTAYREMIGNQEIADFMRSHRAERYEQARVMGGGSSVNGQVAARGLPSDYDEWAKLGAEGWSFADVLAYLKRLERDLDFDGPYHGKDGPIPVRRTFPSSWGRFSIAVRDALVERGIPYLEDVHAEFGDGCFPHVKNNYLDRRISAAMGYLDNATRRHKNLQILDRTLVVSIEFADDAAAGVRVRRDGDTEIKRIGAGEVILATGVMHSPAMLMRNGIGPGKHLRDAGIPVRVDRDGVGQNLQDHPMCGLGVHLRPRGRLPAETRNNFPLTVRWTSAWQDCPPQDMKLSISNRFGWSKAGEQFGTVVFGPYKVYSKGFVRLDETSPEREPQVFLNLLSDERDMARMKIAARFACDLVLNSVVADTVDLAFAGIYGSMAKSLNSRSFLNTRLSNVAAAVLEWGKLSRELIVGLAMGRQYKLDALMNDEGLMESWIREGVMGDWHGVGTCKMGRRDDPLAVVDPQGRVYGTSRLRIADASIMPTIPCANTNISTIMIGEKLSDAILGGDPEEH